MFAARRCIGTSDTSGCVASNAEDIRGGGSAHSPHETPAGCAQWIRSRLCIRCRCRAPLARRISASCSSLFVFVLHRESTVGVFRSPCVFVFLRMSLTGFNYAECCKAIGLTVLLLLTALKLRTNSTRRGANRRVFPLPTHRFQPGRESRRIAAKPIEWLCQTDGRSSSPGI